jgi:glycosyltransferase involved in cell wall biosynthesis
MRILIHDYAGHPFQASLSRSLAQRGHDLGHVYFADNPGPKGRMTQDGDPLSLRFIGISLNGSVNHAAGTGANIGLRRRRNDIAYGLKVAEIVREIKPDVVLSGNTPTDAQRTIIRTCKQSETRFVYWLQDVYSVAISKLLSKKLGPIGAAIGWYYRQQDRRQFRSSDAVVAISEDFRALAASWAGNREKVQVIENWMAIDDVPLISKNNEWAQEHRLNGSFCFVYSGTLGRKHNAGLLVNLAQWCPQDVLVVVAGQGYGIQRLLADAQRLASLKVLPIQPIERYAELLATADVLVANIDQDAGSFAVPSKVLAYLCAGRPILLSASKENLAARTVLRANAGIVVEPADDTGFLSAAVKLHGDAGLRAELGANGRRYAEETFDLMKIADQFEAVLTGTT